MNQIMEKEVNIENMIYEIRWKHVMLASDLAQLYQCKNGTKEINQAVKNNINKPILLIVKNKSLLTKLDIKKYNEQYNNLQIKYSNIFHGRYIIIDKTKVYHLGASINYAGNKVFSINKLEDEIIIKTLLNKVDNIN